MFTYICAQVIITQIKIKEHLGHTKGIHCVSCHTVYALHDHIKNIQAEFVFYAFLKKQLQGHFWTFINY